MRNQRRPSSWTKLSAVFSGAAPVAGEDVAAAHLQLALLAGRQVAPSRVDDAQRHAGQGHADGAGAALAGVRVGEQFIPVSVMP